MKYGYFDDANREYVITTPDTPLPWINYLGCGDFISLISNTSGGYCFYRDARHRRILRYRYNDIPADSNGRYFYIFDGGDVWAPSFMPVKQKLDFYECRHGLGYTKITGERAGLRAEQTVFVPLDDPCEVHRMILTNESGREKRVRLFSFVEFCLWNAYDDMTNYQRNLNTGEVEIEEGVIYHKTEYRERRDHYAFYSVNAPVVGFDADRDAFLGARNGLDAPAAVMGGQPGNSVASGWYPCASHCLDVTLGPGESKTVLFVLGYVENEREKKFTAPNVINKEKAQEMIRRYDSPEKAERALAKLADYWEGLLNRFRVKSPEGKLNRMVNIWNPYQCMVTFNLSRSASYYETGIGRGMGFRDSNQDLLGFVHQIPDRARERIIDIASTQFEEGSAYHQYQPLTKRGNHEIGGGFNDDPLWLILGTVAYIKETGDFGILAEMVPFDNDPDKAAPLMEHLRRSFSHAWNNRGPHGLPLIGRADWNDCLNLNCFSKEPDESFQTYGQPDGRIAESVFIAGMFVLIGRQFGELCKYLGNDAEAAQVMEHVSEMERAVEEHGWDGEWFLRAYDAQGNKVGSHECEEGQIYIEPQGFCVMAGIGKSSGHAAKALAAVEERLSCAHGIRILQPAYTKYHLELGEVSSYPPGYKENGGVFCHNNPWVAIAETVLGHGDRAFEIYKTIAPAYLEEKSDLHRTEPYVYSQMIAGVDAPNAGEAKNSWLTGTAAWNYYAATQYLLGIRPAWNGLEINPCIPQSWDAFEVDRVFRGVCYHIKVVKTGTGQITIETDGNVEGTVVSAREGQKECTVSVTL